MKKIKFIQNKEKKRQIQFKCNQAAFTTVQEKQNMKKKNNSTWNNDKRKIK